MQTLAKETGGKSYKAHKYGLDNAEIPFIDYGEDNMVWKKTFETYPHRSYVKLEDKCKKMISCGEPLLTYFLDGSRRVYKVDDIAYKFGKRSLIYPVIAGQIGVACCKRTNKIVKLEELKNEIVISLPGIANADGKPGFFEAIAKKLNNISEFRHSNIKISSVIPYKVSKK